MKELLIIVHLAFILAITISEFEKDKLAKQLAACQAQTQTQESTK